MDNQSLPTTCCAETGGPGILAMIDDRETASSRKTRDF
jgi:hypothetical protein